MAIINERIKELRTERNLTQAQLGAQIGVSQQAIHYWERGINEPKSSYIIQLCTFFDVSADYLLGLKND